MWRVNQFAVFLIVVGALLFVANQSYSTWNQNKTTSKEANLIHFSFDAPLNETLDVPNSIAEPSNLTAVVPPYIILGGTWDSWGETDQQAAVRISIQTVTGSYSEYAAQQIVRQSSHAKTSAYAQNSGLPSFGTLNTSAFE
ncbi:MAG: hypothetical protein H8E48_08005 [Chloroflexi bacterium]|nr:hypothetical protein [Chloroflexota bacterium]